MQQRGTALTLNVAEAIERLTLLRLVTQRPVYERT